MTKNEIIHYLNSKRIDPLLATEIITDYLKSIGKSDEDTTKMINMCTSNPNLMLQALSSCNQYILRKFNICSVISKEGFILKYF